MLKAGNKHPLKESLGVGNSGPSRLKRRRYDNVILLREEEENSDNLDNANRQAEPPRQILRAGRKRKTPTEENERIASSAPSSSNSKPVTSTVTAPENDENDIISELAKKFKKARLRPVFFTISSFIEQTVGEVGFTLADEAETEVTISLNLNLMNKAVSVEEPPPENGKHLVDVDEDNVPDLVKDCCFSPRQVNCDSLTVRLEEEHCESLIILEDTCQEINNNV